MLLAMLVVIIIKFSGRYWFDKRVAGKVVGSINARSTTSIAFYVALFLKKKEKLK